MRVLMPGGVAIFETPNPDNVLVGSNFFYFDPTHRHPLPSQLMHFLFETRGFQPIEVINLHPWEAARIKAAANSRSVSTITSLVQWITPSWGGRAES